METKTFIPEWREERRRAEAEPGYRPVVFHLRAINGYDQDYYDMLMSLPEEGEEPESTARRLARLNREWVFRQVERIEGLRAADGGEIADGRQFVERRGEIEKGRELYYEVVAEIGRASGLSEDEEKN